MKLRTVAVTVTGLVGLALTAGPAHADAGLVTVASNGPAATPLAGQDACSTLYVGTVLTGRGCFESYGDKIWAEDLRSDGLRVIVETRYNYDRPNDECHQVGGVGAGGYCNYNMREDGQVSFRVVTRNGATGPNDTTGAWTRWLAIG
ncbi:hypothetical protein [Streptomyces sp. NPDC001880]